MKDSGVPWLGRVPEHWAVVPICAIAKERSRSGFPQEELLSVYLGRGVIRFSDSDERRTNPTSDDLSNYQLVEPGNFVLNNQQAWRGSVGVSRHKGIVSPAYLVLELNNQLDPSFANRLLTDRSMVAQYLVSSKGVGSIQRNLYWPHLRRASALIPPAAEQTAAVRFLSHADRRIRHLIRSKQKLITLLEEQRQSIIFRTVAHGLNPDSDHVDSGSAILGAVPHHWPMFRAKYLFKQVSPAVPADADVVTCFRDGQVTLRTNRRTQGYTVAIKELGYQGIRPGHLVLHSMDAFAGAIGISDSYGKCSPEYVLCESARDDVYLPYFATLLRSLALRGLFVQLCPSVRERAPRVRFGDFGAFRLPTPPLGEQVAIVAKISHESDTISVTLKSERRQLELLREFRTRLISDIVTGKLDVREAAARLPAEAAEGDDPFDDTDPDGEEDDDSAAESGPEDGDGG